MPFPLIYLKIGAALILLIGLVWVYFYISSVFEERDKLRISEAVMTSQVMQYQKMIASNIKLNEEINSAIAKIRLTSNNYIQAVDSGRPLVVADGDIVNLIPAGVLSETPTMPSFSNASTNSIKPVSEAR